LEIGNFVFRRGYKFLVKGEGVVFFDEYLCAVRTIISLLYSTYQCPRATKVQGPVIPYCQRLYYHRIEVCYDMGEREREREREERSIIIDASSLR
jgi:hypothetical protein